MTERFQSRKFFPIPGWLRGYPEDWLHADVIAGLTSAAVVIPKAMAYATIAGLPVQIGVYTALVPAVVYALLGTSRPLSVSTTTTLAILTAAALGNVAPSGDTSALIAASATLSVLVGTMLVLAFALRLGFVADFISEPVLTGFKSAIGLIIVVDQLPKLLGIHIEKSGFFRDIVAIVQHLPTASILTVLLAIFLLVLIFGLQRFRPNAPVPLIAVGIAIIASFFLSLGERGVATVGEIPRALPDIVLPRTNLLLTLWPAAAAIALMSFTELIAAARAFGGSDEPRPHPNQELLALGAANIAGGLLSAMPSGGGTTQTAVNQHAGARTQVAGTHYGRRCPSRTLGVGAPCQLYAAGSACRCRRGLLR